MTHSFAGDDWKALPRSCPQEARSAGAHEAEEERRRQSWTVLAEHIYYDQHGERFLKVRKCRDGDGKKQYPQYHWDGNGWAKGKPSAPKIPYRLPQLIAAPTTGIDVFRARARRMPTPSPRSASWPRRLPRALRPSGIPALTPYFKDRHVVILPDADRPGRAHAQKVAKAIHGVAASVRILDLYPERHDGSDVSDFIADDTAGGRLAKLVKEAPLWGPSGHRQAPA